MIAELILTVALTRGGDAPIPPPNPHGAPGHSILYAYDPADWAAQREECRRILATDPPGSTCVVQPGREIIIPDSGDITGEILNRAPEIRRDAQEPRP
ncbi:MULTISPECIES: hypothetical protein [unclassified Pseudonocardia]|uniref:hypothetical protein n=1 Tax=unclassified Pseudonocardia TaxID=2619320 RepID=UPI00094B2935|nr:MULTISPECIES: hypothetical protein [unclassified Pseudonocardia]OLL89560.1 hypothetical protein Ae331Ps2_6234c [Pseudonocardia sp. Ae331_Ps2]